MQQREAKAFFVEARAMVAVLEVTHLVKANDFELGDLGSAPSGIVCPSP
jgi:hypothetical protein